MIYFILGFLAGIVTLGLGLVILAVRRLNARGELKGIRVKGAKVKETVVHKLGGV